MRVWLVDLVLHLHPTVSDRSIRVSKDGDPKHSVSLLLTYTEAYVRQEDGLLEVTIPRSVAEQKGLL